MHSHNMGIRSLKGCTVGNLQRSLHRSPVVRASGSLRKCPDSSRRASRCSPGRPLAPGTATDCRLRAWGWGWRRRWMHRHSVIRLGSPRTYFKTITVSSSALKERDDKETVIVLKFILGDRAVDNFFQDSLPVGS